MRFAGAVSVRLRPTGDRQRGGARCDQRERVEAVGALRNYVELVWFGVEQSLYASVMNDLHKVIQKTEPRLKEFESSIKCPLRSLYSVTK